MNLTPPLRPRPRPALSAVAPCYNEAKGLPELYRELTAACRAAAGESYELVLVNDGSTDGTHDILLGLAAADPHVAVINLARNFGQASALTAGLEHCRGERILIIDADLQDPPSLLPEMMALMDQGAEVVYGQRRSRQGESLFKKTDFLSARKALDWNALEARSLLAGSLVIVGCFFAGQSVGYRGIYLLLVLPGLLQLRRSVADRALRTLLSLTTAAALMLLWQEGIRHSIVWGLREIGIEDGIPGIPSTIFWVLRELLWWWTVSVLATMIALFALQSPLGRAAARVFTPIPQPWSRP